VNSHSMIVPSCDALPSVMAEDIPRSQASASNSIGTRDSKCDLLLFDARNNWFFAVPASPRFTDLNDQFSAGSMPRRHIHAISVDVMPRPMHRHRATSSRDRRGCQGSMARKRRHGKLFRPIPVVDLVSGTESAAHGRSFALYAGRCLRVPTQLNRALVNTMQHSIQENKSEQ
jgi:hypothetical protein